MATDCAVPRRRRGFTLLEVLIVVAIIALLAAFVVPQFFRTHLQAKIDGTGILVSPGGPVATGLNLYHLHLGEYPATLAGLTDKPEDEAKAAKWRGPYITDPASLKDAWDHDLQYKCPGDVHSDGYDLYSFGPDGQDSTDDDIANYHVGEVIRSPGN